MISIKKMHEWVYEQRHELSFVFVDYKESDDELEILKESGLVPIEHIDWECLSIEAQGYGVIQLCRPLMVLPTQTKSQFYRGFLKAYDKYRLKEVKKHEKFSKKFVDPDSIDW
jgi:hypothetical protein